MSATPCVPSLVTQVARRAGQVLVCKGFTRYDGPALILSDAWLGSARFLLTSRGSPGSKPAPPPMIRVDSESTTETVPK
jgi:hypothetical protein